MCVTELRLLSVVKIDVFPSFFSRSRETDLSTSRAAKELGRYTRGVDDQIADLFPFI